LFIIDFFLYPSNLFISQKYMYMLINYILIRVRDVIDFKLVGHG